MAIRNGIEMEPKVFQDTIQTFMFWNRILLSLYDEQHVVEKVKKKKKPSLSYHRNQTLHAIQLRWFIKFLYINKKGDNNTMYSIVITIIVITIINEGNCVII